MPAVLPIRSFDQLKLLADPRRLAILQRLMAGPATLTQLGQELGEHPAWIRHHLKRLEGAGLVELAETRRTAGALEKVYRARAGGYLLQELILPSLAARPVVVFSGSHDIAIEGLAARLASQLTLLILPNGSLNGLATLRLGLGHLAGCHLLDPGGEYNLPFVRHTFPDRAVHVVTLAHRTQGLLAAPRNPKGLHDLTDLARPDVVFVNRNPGSGTRLWLDQQLDALHIPASSIRGYNRHVDTHTATALAVQRGEADAAIGLQAAAAQRGLYFQPLFVERYDLVIPEEQVAALAPLLQALQAATVRHTIDALAGYETAHTGEEIPL
jgi:putative molybdopterin biosynthesis protein